MASSVEELAWDPTPLVSSKNNLPTWSQCQESSKDSDQKLTLEDLSSEREENFEENSNISDNNQQLSGHYKESGHISKELYISHSPVVKVNCDHNSQSPNDKCSIQPKDHHQSNDYLYDHSVQPKILQNEQSIHLTDGLYKHNTLFSDDSHLVQTISQQNVSSGICKNSEQFTNGYFRPAAKHVDSSWKLKQAYKGQVKLSIYENYGLLTVHCKCV